MRLDDAFARYCGLLSLAEEYYSSGNLAASAGLAQIAARYAFPANVGLFSSPRLERLLLRLGEQVERDTGESPGRPGSLRHILHILSYAKPIGGDSRFAWRWIQQDQQSRHSVAITSQAEVARSYDVPTVLRTAVENSGGFIRVLQAPEWCPLDRSRELRVLCQQVDVAAIHTYPYDIVPVVALAAGCEAVKTVVVNHSDHTFWLGGSIAHSVAHLRRQSPHFLRSRRGLHPERSSILPIPMDLEGTELMLPGRDRREVKRALGHDPDATILLTIASPFKYSAAGQQHFLNQVLPVIAACPKAVLIAVGPSQDGAWEAAKRQTNGRVIALGRRWDNRALIAAADVYLDSVPFSSITSLLEAGMAGLPLLGLREADADLALLGPGAPGLDESMILCSDSESYRGQLLRLINEPELRQSTGEQAQSQIRALHAGHQWQTALATTYAQLESATIRGCFARQVDEFTPSKLDVALIQLFKQEQGPMRIRQIIRQFTGHLPYRVRFRVTSQLNRIGLDMCMLNLVPPPIDIAGQNLGRRIKRYLA